MSCDLAQPAQLFSARTAPAQAACCTPADTGALGVKLFGLAGASLRQACLLVAAQGRHDNHKATLIIQEARL